MQILRPARPLAFLSLVFLLAACSREAPDPNAVATPDSRVTVDYKGTLEDGMVFDEGTGVTFSLNEVIPGFKTGIAGMRVGETKTLVVPPEEGYGAMGAPPDIPPNATLTFVVTLQEVVR